jgi:C4-dicarboxylate-specific signal transduction histidine kinase
MVALVPTVLVVTSAQAIEAAKRLRLAWAALAVLLSAAFSAVVGLGLRKSVVNVAQALSEQHANLESQVLTKSRQLQQTQTQLRELMAQDHQSECSTGGVPRWCRVG